MKSKNFLFTLFLLVSITVCRAQVEFDVLNSPTQNNFIASSFINNNEGWLADNNATLWHTQNGGATISTISTGNQFSKLAFTDAGNGFALGTGVAYKTSDGGISWSALQLDVVGSALYFIDKNTGFISGNHMIYKTSNNGSTWSTIPLEVASFIDYYFINSSAGVAAADDYTNNKSLWRTTDGGATWSNVFNDYHYYINSVWFSSEDVGWAAGYYDAMSGATKQPIILKSTDGGLTWKQIYRNHEVFGIGETLIDIRFKNELEGFAISNLFVNLITTDGGQNWLRADETENLNFPVYNGYYKTIDGYTSLYLIGEDGYVLKWK